MESTEAVRAVNGTDQGRYTSAMLSRRGALGAINGARTVSVVAFMGGPVGRIVRTTKRAARALVRGLERGTKVAVRTFRHEGGVAVTLGAGNLLEAGR